MPMTHTKAAELLTDYQERLDLAQKKLSDLDKVNSNVAPFIPKLLNALRLIADPSKASDAYFIELAQKDLTVSLEKIKGVPVTTLEYLDNKYMSQDLDEKGHVVKPFTKLQDEIRKGLKAEAVAKIPSALQDQIKEGLSLKAAPIVEVSPTLQDQIRDGVSLKATPIVEVSPKVEKLVTHETTNLDESDSTVEEVQNSVAEESVNTQNALKAEQTGNGVDWSLWLEYGLLGASLVASLAFCVTAAVTLNPVLGGVGVVATAASGVALARTLGFFNSNPVTPEVSGTEEEIQDNNSVASMASD
jgi:hypothetical protein